MNTRYYQLLQSKPDDPVYYFSVGSGGRYDRWDPATKTWVHVTSGPARDYYSRAIENGEAVRTTREAVH